MAEPRVISFFVDLDKPIQKETKKELFATGDSNAHEFIGTVKRNGEAVDLSGMGVEATYLSMASGLSTHIDGTIRDGKIVVKLSDACYHLAGNARFSIALKKGDFHLTVFSCEMMMTATGSSIVYDPNAVIPSISDLIRKIDELEERVEEVNANIPEDISSVANVIATVNQNSASIAGLQTDVNTAKSDAQAAVSQSNTNATNISAVQNTANDNKADISSLSSRVATAEENISTVNNNLSAANSKLSSVEGKANTNASDISNLKTTVAGHTSNISSIRNDVDSANATAETAEQNAESAKTLVQTLQSAVNTNLETIRETLTDHQEDINTNAGNIAKLNANALMKNGHVAGKWFAADENGTITQVTAPDSNVTTDKIRDALGYTPASVEELDREIDELDAKKVNRSGMPTNKILGSSDVGDLRYFDLDVGVTAKSIEDALGYVPANDASTEQIFTELDKLENYKLDNRGLPYNRVVATDYQGSIQYLKFTEVGEDVTATKIQQALGYIPLKEITAEGIEKALGYEPADKAATDWISQNKLGLWNNTPNKYVVTDSAGSIRFADPPAGGSGGSAPPTGPYQMLVTDGDQVQAWEERTHYPYIGRVTILPEVDYSTIDYVENTLSQDIAPYMQGEIVAGKTYYLTFGNEEMECLAYVDGPGMTVIAENNDFISARVGIIYYSTGQCLLSVNDGGANPKTTIKVEGPGIAYKKIDKVYLPDDIGGGGDGIQILHGVVDGTKVTFDKTVKEICDLARSGELSKYKILVDAQITSMGRKTVEMTTVNWWEDFTGEEIQLNIGGTFYDVAAGLPREAWIEIYKSGGEYRDTTFTVHNIADLPEPDGSYEGKVLGVEGGRYAFVDMPSGGAGGAGGAALMFQIVDAGGALVMVDIETGEPITYITPEVLMQVFVQGAQISFLVMSETDAVMSIKMYSISEIGGNADELYAILGNHGNGTPIMMAADGTLSYQS